jgi:hypothetical protein
LSNYTLGTTFNTFSNWTNIQYAYSNQLSNYAISNIVYSNLVGSNASFSNLFIANTIGVGVTNPIAPFQFSNNPGINRQLLLFNLSNNDHEYFGFGIDTSNTSNLLRYQSCYGDQVFSASRTAALSYDLMFLRSSGRIDIASNALYVAGQQVVYGRDYFVNEDATTATNANTTYLTRTTLTQTLEGGTYFLGCYAELGVGTNGRYSQTSLTLDGVEVGVSDTYIAVSSQFTSVQIVDNAVLTPGSHTIVLRYRRATYSGNGTVSIRNSRVFIWRVL